MSLKGKSIALYGGSFSPPHKGHILAARAFLECTCADELVVMPLKKPPHKQLDAFASDEDRLNMCRLAFYSDEVLKDRCRGSEFEIKRDKTSYTVETIEYLIGQGCREIYLLIGTDMLLTFESWHRYRDIFSYASVCFVNRYESDRGKCSECAERFRQEYGARIIEINAPVFDVSSSEIREKIAQGSSVSGLLCDEVVKYVEKNSLYKRK